MLTAQEIEALGYYQPKLLATGEWASTQLLLYTGALIVGIDRFGYRTRFCYERAGDAMAALNLWDGVGDPPGDWLIQKPEQREGPGMAEYCRKRGL